MRKPSLKSIGERIYSHLAVAPPKEDGVGPQRPKTVAIPAPEGDWEIVTD